MKKILFLLIFTLASLTVNAQTKYYVKNGGNNTLDGLTDATAWADLGKIDTAIVAGDSVFFKRGNFFRGQLNAVSGTYGKHTYYGDYGAGAKPKFYGSVEVNDLADWTEISANVWKCDTTIAVDVGNIIFDNEASCGVKVMTATPLPDSLDVQGEYWYSHAGDTLVMYSVGNPASVYTDIELALYRNVIHFSTGRSYVTLQNLDIRYGAANGIGHYGSAQSVYVLGCEAHYIGGADQANNYVSRFGNGIEIYAGHTDVLIEGCYATQCYDAGLTIQGYSGTYSVASVKIINNISDSSEYAFEFFFRSPTDISNIYIENNTFAYSGYGWGHSQRPDGAMGTAMRLFNISATKTNVNIRNNLLYESTDRLVYLYILGDLTNINLDYNLYYTSTGVTGRTSWGPTNYATLANWQTATAQEANAVGTDPLIVGSGTIPTNYKLQSASPAKDVGYATAWTTDYGGYTVPVGSSRDIGAWEYGADVDPPNWHPTGLGWEDKLHKFNFRDDVNFTVAPTIGGAPLELATLSGLTATTNDLNNTSGSTGNFQGQIAALDVTVDSKADTSLSNLASVAINTHLLPGTDGAVNLGSATKKFGDVHLDSTKVINFNNGDVTITHAVNKLTMAGGTLDLPTGVHRIGTDTIAVKSDITGGDSFAWIDSSNYYTKTYNVLDYGASPLGVIDATAAIQAAATAANADPYGKLVGQGVFLISDTIRIKSHADFTGARFTTTDEDLGVIFFGDSSAYTYRKYVTFPEVYCTPHTAGVWGTGTGITIANVNDCFFKIPQIWRFGTGLKVVAYAGKGSCYSSFDGGSIYQNKVGIELQPISSGWVNENLFLNAHIFMTSADGVVAGTRAMKLDSATNTPNNNIFIKPCLEGSYWEYLVECYGKYNAWYSGRYETTKDFLFGTTTTPAQFNEVVGGYGAFDLDFVVNGADSYGNVKRGANTIIATGSSTKPPFIGANFTSNASPTYLILHQDNLNYSDPTTAYAFSASYNALKGKTNTNTQPQWEMSNIASSLGLKFGSGSAVADAALKRAAAGVLKIDSALRLETMISAIGTTEGTLYADTDHKLYYHNGTGYVDITSATTTTKVTIGTPGDAENYNFASIGNSDEQVLTLTNILPAKCRVTAVEIVCTETLNGSGTHEIVMQFGTTSSGEELIAATGAGTMDQGNEVQGIIDATKPAAVQMNWAAARSLYLTGDIDANWDTITAGKWSVYITYQNYTSF